MTTTATAPDTLVGSELVEHESAGAPGFVEHRVLFNREITLGEFERYVAERRFFGYDPCGYGGTARVEGRTGTWIRYSTCD